MTTPTLNKETIIQIKKSELSKLSYENVEIKDKNISNRKNTIKSFIKMRDNESSKAEIVFMTDRGLFKVISQILSTGEDFLILKGGFFIPRESIVQLK